MKRQERGEIQVLTNFLVFVLENIFFLVIEILRHTELLQHAGDSGHESFNLGPRNQQHSV